jgi:hypothetical protein
VNRITKAALGGIAGCALVLSGTEAASGALSGIYKLRESLTDFVTGETGPFDSARAKSTIKLTADAEGRPQTTFEVRMTGIDMEGLELGRTFGGHLHVGPCDTVTNLGHYRHDPTLHPEEGLAKPPNELWFNFTPDADGMAYDVQTAPWVPVDENGDGMSIVVHLGTAEQLTKDSPKQACFPLDVF